MTTALDFDSKVGCSNGPTTTIAVGEAQLAAHISHFPAEPGLDPLTVVTIGLGLDSVDLTPAEAAALAPQLRQFADQLALLADHAAGAR